MIRDLISRLTKALFERSVPARRNHKARIKLWFDPDGNSDPSIGLGKQTFILGETVDISRTGIGFVAPSIRLKEKYLVGQDRLLNVEIELPNGTVFLRAVGCRYEKVGKDVSSEKFLVGITISKLIGSDKETFETFLKLGPRRLHSAARALELGIDR